MRRSTLRAGRAVTAGGVAALCLLIFGGPGCAAATGPAPIAELAQAPPSNVESDIAQLHQRLGITPAQEPRFAAVAEIMRENARAAGQIRPPVNSSAVEALRAAIQYGQQDLVGMRRLLPALEALYASLSPAQQRAADMVFRQGPGE